jgi:pimeloyl-ACP methyl ester carboxylesterase
VIEQLRQAIDVGGATIRWDSAGPAEAAAGHAGDLLLLHGNGANHMWWYKVRPELERNWRVIRMDFSGHGDSSWRETYRPEDWLDEAVGVLDAAGSRRPVVVGHSRGGRLALALAARHPERVAAVVVLDASVRPPHRYRDFTFRGDETGQRRERNRARHYGTLDTALAAFKLMPSQPIPPLSQMLPLAHYSLRHGPDGWTWKFDRHALGQFDDAWVDAWAARVNCPVGFIYGGESVVVDDDIAEYARERIPGPAEVVRIEDAYHHLILDHPEEVAAAIGKLLAWQASLV